MDQVSITINPRTVHIGSQVYALNNLARVQTVRIHKKRSKRLGCAIVLAGFYLFFAVAGIAQMRAATVVPLALLVFCVGVVTYALFVNYSRRKFGLILESTGVPYTAVESPDKGELIRVQAEIVRAIEDPPEVARTINVGNAVLGDQVNQSGSHNTGKVARS